ncbi:hypothetical protein CPJCM30710_16930 [Clostridium polyendosporum]|uniref:DUF445 family protein n=1 Tax=Clostridium polyendosporum TaxID=69208 RepID=A0A919VGB8_9CLOT|nr:DUF445 family protein [Clostridium polyendosporum]GIM29027.1 hypothetical protein CPJCM30710_16930 [Clostridium polyendosporum]
MKYIFGIVIGAIIGYITNWIAIKMLFRPYTEKKIWGLRVPFTPGLIPKERSRIAQSVGETVGTHLLSTDTVIRALESEKIENHIKKLIDNKIKELSSSNDSIRTKFEKNFGLYFQEFKLKLEMKISSYLIAKLKEDRLINKVLEIIVEKVKISLKEKPEKLIEFLKKDEMREKIFKNLQLLGEQQNIKEAVVSFILEGLKEIEDSPKLVKDLVPEETFGAINVYIFNEREAITNKIVDILREDVVAEKIKQSISTNILSSMTPLVSMFLSVDSLYEKFLAAIDGYLREDENKIAIASVVGKALAEFGNKELKDVFSKIPQNSKEQIAKYCGDLIVSNTISDRFFKKSVDCIISSLENFNLYEELLKVLDEGFEMNIKNYIKDTISVVVKSTEVEKNISLMVSNVFDQLLDVSINQFVNDEKGTITKSIFSIVKNTYKNFIENEAVNVIKLINIPRIVEEQINSFEVDYVERIILDIADKELKAITWLGALLGGIIGILSPVLGSL